MPRVARRHRVTELHCHTQDIQVVDFPITHIPLLESHYTPNMQRLDDETCSFQCSHTLLGHIVRLEEFKYIGVCRDCANILVADMTTFLCVRCASKPQPVEEEE